MEIKIGCCGFPVGKKKYYRDFTVVELQDIFYRIPNLRLIEKWRNSAPKEFEFTLKAPQLITHEPSSPTYRKLGYEISPDKKKFYGFFKPTYQVFQAWNHTKKIAEILKAKVIIFQTPNSFTPFQGNIQNMRKFFAVIKKGKNENTPFLAFEPRGKWPETLVKEICQEFDLIHCVDPFKNKSVWGRITYFRLHGVDGYRYKYTREDLEQLKAECKVNVNSCCYCMFNNVYMYPNALEFKKLVDEQMTSHGNSVVETP